MLALCTTTVTKADILHTSGFFFFNTMETDFGSYGGHHFERTGNVFTSTYKDDVGSYVNRITMINKCTYRYDFERPPTIATPSDSMQIDLSRASQRSVSVGRERNYDVYVISGIRTCNVGNHPNYWNTATAPGSCTSKYKQSFTLLPEQQLAAINAMIDYCHRQ